jgi:putative nucleotidyltransferase with HDIG domain
MLHGPDNILRKRAQLAGLSASIFVGAVFVARLMLPGHTWLPYLVPLGAVGIAITAWLGILPGAVSAVALAGLVSLPLDQPIEALLYWACSGVLGCLVMRRGERISDFFRAGLASGLAQIAVFLVFHPASPPAVDVVQIGTYIGVAAVSSLLSAALAPAILYVTGLLFDIVTPIQLIELSRPSHPLLQQMLTQAPGTYHHSLMVANMAEQAAERISADSLLTRVGAYYHDIGKSLHPYFFIENQSDGANVHNQLDPQTSSRVLQNHVYDGLELARRYRLPSRIRAFITEHHGSTKTNYQYVLASQANGQPVDDEPFRYPGPRPQSKETALVMLADGCEAAVRARKPDTVEQTDGVIRKVIGERLADHQLDDANLTLREIETIRQSFLDTLRGAYHPRIEYPPIPASQTAEALPEPHRPAAQA